MDAPPCRPTPPSPRALPHLPDGIVEDILLRVPADEPAGLLRSALTCKRWARLMDDRGFRRRYRERHRPAPMLGFLANLVRTDGVARFFPTAGFRTPRADRDGYRAHDARHGRVLLNRVPGTDLPTGHQDSASALVVWDPITDEQRHLPLLQLRRREVRNWNAAVLCAGTAGGDDDACDHLDCGAGPFRVVFIGMNAKEIFAHVYSSESGAWSQPASGELLIPGEPQEDDPIDEAPGNALPFFAVPVVLDWAIRNVATATPPSATRRARERECGPAELVLGWRRRKGVGLEEKGEERELGWRRRKGVGPASASAQRTASPSASAMQL
ncbi:hypothetical protein SETIT_2G008900v2 [Setaria italica]|uniref:F-box domain-containing protein n=1 Tax=Setaria italica TaxID=4555 RepID=A0A368PUA7_SETIT|nr:hypothetical protein SETIT_2G008900v2 [Setaria italica]